MTKLQTENMVCDLIKFLKNWGLWKETEIFTRFGKRYADSTDAAAGEWGFRDMPDVHVSENDRHKTLDEFCESYHVVKCPILAFVPTGIYFYFHPNIVCFRYCSRQLTSNQTVAYVVYLVKYFSADSISLVLSAEVSLKYFSKFLVVS